jgi:hypothetical protein
VCIGVCKAVVDVLNAHTHDAGIVETSLRTFWNLSACTQSNTPANGTHANGTQLNTQAKTLTQAEADNNKFLLAGVGSIEAILQCLCAHTRRTHTDTHTGTSSSNNSITLLIVQYLYKLVDVSVSKRMNHFVPSSSGRDSFDASNVSNGWDTYRRQLRYLEAKKLLTQSVMENAAITCEWTKQTCRAILTVL